MSTRLPLPGAPEVEVIVTRHPRAKRMTLRVSQIDGAVRMTVPPRARLATATGFLAEKAAWIREQHARFAPHEAMDYGATLLIEGVARTLVPGPKDAPIALSSDALRLPTRRGALGPRLSAWLKMRARDRLTPACARYADQVDRPIAGLRLRDTRSRWGSCTAQGVLMFNWRLILAPPPVLDYVAAHEVAHLVEMNHSPAFWAVVARLMPDYQTHRTWLRTHGATLHQPRFD